MGQFSINEASGFHDANPWMFAERVGANAGIMDDMKATFSATDYGFTHEKLFPFNGDVKEGNTRATVITNGITYANVLTSSFNILQLDGKLKLRAGDLPITLEGGFVRNTEESAHVGRDGNILGLTLATRQKRIPGKWRITIRCSAPMPSSQTSSMMTSATPAPTRAATSSGWATPSRERPAQGHILQHA